MDERTFANELLGDLDFTCLDVERDEDGGKSRFQMQADAKESGHVYIDLKKTPHDRSTSIRIVTEAILRGRTLGVRPALAGKIRAALEN